MIKESHINSPHCKILPCKQLNGDFITLLVFELRFYIPKSTGIKFVQIIVSELNYYFYINTKINFII